MVTEQWLMLVDVQWLVDCRMSVVQHYLLALCTVARVVVVLVQDSPLHLAMLSVVVWVYGPLVRS